jgi:TolA-binding protein
MKFAHGAAGLLGLAMLFFLFATAIAQRSDVRRAQPADELPPPRALPIEEITATPPPVEMVPPDRRQLEYANALFTRKLYDLAIPEYQRYLDDYPGASGRANAYFSLGECYRNLNKPSSARTNFQRVLNDYDDSEFAGPAAYALGEMAFTQKDY